MSGIATVGTTIREASLLYNVPFETLRRRVTENVELGFRPGPPTVLTERKRKSWLFT